MNNPYIFFIFFICMWVGICVLLSYWSGWRELAQYYRYQSQRIIKKRYFQWASMRGVNYRSCLTIGSNAEGIYFSVLFLFAAGSPRLFIPWSDIKITKKKFWWLPVLELKLVKVPAVTIMVSQGLESFFQEVCGRTLMIEDGGLPNPTAFNKYQWAPFIIGALGLCAALYAAFFASHK